MQQLSARSTESDNNFFHKQQECKIFAKWCHPYMLPPALLAIGLTVLKQPPVIICPALELFFMQRHHTQFTLPPPCTPHETPRCLQLRSIRECHIPNSKPKEETLLKAILFYQQKLVTTLC